MVNEKKMVSKKDSSDEDSDEKETTECCSTTVIIDRVHNGFKDGAENNNYPDDNESGGYPGHLVSFCLSDAVRTEEQQRKPLSYHLKLGPCAQVVGREAQRTPNVCPPFRADT